jgi:hypothetical protein
MAFACHAATTLAEGSEEVNSYLANESSPADDNWIASEERGVRSNNQPLIESKAALDTGTKHKDEETFESFEQQTEQGIIIQHEETDETAPRIHQKRPFEQTNDRTDDYVAVAQNAVEGHAIQEESSAMHMTSGSSVDDENGDASEDEGGDRQVESSVEEVSETDKGFVPETGKIPTDHASVITNTVSELDGDKNGAEASRPSGDDGMSTSFEAEQFSTSTETDDVLDDNNAPETTSAEVESDTSGQEASLVGNNLDYDHASTFHGDEESDDSTQRLEVNDRLSTGQSTVEPGQDEIPDGEADSMDDGGGTNHDLSSDDDMLNTETGSLLNEDVDVGSTVDSVERTESTFDGEEEANNSMQHEIYKTISAVNATHESTLTHGSADESEEVGASLDIESATQEAAVEESVKDSTHEKDAPVTNETITTVNATHGSTLTNASADESDKATVSVDTTSATPEDVAEESVKDSTYEEVLPATNETGPDKTLASADVDDDFIDFDAVDATRDPTLTNTSDDESDEATASLDTESATPEAVAEESVKDSTHEKDGPATNETTPDMTLASAYADDDVIDFDIIDRDTDVVSTETQEDSPGSETTSDPKELADKISLSRNLSEPVADEETGATSADDDSERVSSEQATESSGQHNSAKSTAPKKGSLAEFFKKVSKGDEQLGKGAPTSPGAAASKKSAKANIVRRKEHVVETTIPLPMEEKKASDPDEGGVDEIPKYTGAWGSRKHSTSSSSRVPDDALRQLLLNIQEPKDGEAKDAPEAENNAIPDEISADATESGDEKESKDGLRDDIANGGENAAETIDEKERQATASDYVVVDNENAAKVQKSVNTEFVDGLDDIDKFLEEVDPPDELDVGAAGSSIQEVLIGQSVQIVIKRTKLGFNFVNKFVRRKFAEVKTKMDEFVARRTNEDGEFALFTRQEVDAAVEKSIRIGRRVLKGVQEILNDLFGDDLDEDLLNLDLDLDQMQAKIVNLRQKQSLPRSGNVAATKESFDADAHAR